MPTSFRAILDRAGIRIQKYESAASHRIRSGVPDDEIIYIPESAYDNGFLDPLGVYTKRDFIELAGNRARELFDYCDWQSPEAAWNEIESEG